MSLNPGRPVFSPTAHTRSCEIVEGLLPELTPLASGSDWWFWFGVPDHKGDSPLQTVTPKRTNRRRKNGSTDTAEKAIAPQNLLLVC